MFCSALFRAACSTAACGQHTEVGAGAEPAVTAFGEAVRIVTATQDISSSCGWLYPHDLFCTLWLLSV